MSLFLGKVHYWLFDKIKAFEQLEQDILQYAKNQGIDTESWQATLYEEIGPPTQNLPLEDQIDTGNIHGWLQFQIQKAEKRQACIVTAIKQTNPDFHSSLSQVFYDNGKILGQKNQDSSLVPEDAYQFLNNYILEGMPCDRAIDYVASTPEEFSWKFTRCLHKGYWEEMGGDIQDFYNLRNAWTQGFIESMSPQLKYSVDEKDPTYQQITANVFTIKKVV